MVFLFCNISAVGAHPIGPYANYIKPGEKDFVSLGFSCLINAPAGRMDFTPINVIERGCDSGSEPIYSASTR